MAMTHQRADETLNDALTGAATPHVWVHTGDPGAAGTANVAQISESNVARKPASFGAPGNHATNTERRCLSSNEQEWTGAQIDASQELTHFSVWSALSDGQVEFIGPITDAPKTTGSDGAKFETGDIEVAISVHVKP